MDHMRTIQLGICIRYFTNVYNHILCVIGNCSPNSIFISIVDQHSCHFPKEAFKDRTQRRFYKYILVKFYLLKSVHIRYIFRHSLNKSDRHSVKIHPRHKQSKYAAREKPLVFLQLNRATNALISVVTTLFNLQNIVTARWCNACINGKKGCLSLSNPYHSMRNGYKNITWF